MAKTAVIETKVKAEVKEAIEDVKKFGDSVDDLRKKVGEGAEDASKDWGGFAKLFSGLLPRNVQMMIRKFESTFRAVGRLSKGLKFLKGAFAGLGIGLLIIALETLIDRWDDISRLISGVTKEQERYNERINAGTKALEEYNTRNSEYIRIVNDTTEETNLRSEALSNLATSLREVRDLDIESADGLERFNKAIERQLDLVRIQNEEQTLLNQIADLRIENNEAEGSWWQRAGQDMFRRGGAAGALEEKRAGIQAQMNALIADYQQLQKDRLALEAETTAELDRQAAKQERLRLLEAARLKYGKDWEFQMQQMEEADDEAFEREANNELMAQFRRDQALEERNRRQKEADEAMYAEMDAQRLANQLAEEAARDKELRDELRLLDLIAQARNSNFRAAENISTQLERLSEEGTNAQKAFAVTSVLLSQAQAVQSAITGALKAAAQTGAAAPFTAPLFIAQMVGIALSSFAQVRSILKQAGANAPSGGSGGGGGRGVTNALVPQGAGGRQLDLGIPAQAYVVQSQLQGQMHFQSNLAKRLRL
jgi:hypothetical protein